MIVIITLKSLNCVVQHKLNSHTRFNLWGHTRSFLHTLCRCAPHTWSLDAVSTRSPFQYGALTHHVLATARISRPLPRSCLEILSRLCILARRVAGWNCNQCLQLAVNVGEPHAMLNLQLRGAGKQFSQMLVG